MRSDRPAVAASVPDIVSLHPDQAAPSIQRRSLPARFYTAPSCPGSARTSQVAMPHIVPKRILVAGLGAVALSSALLAQSHERVLYATALDAKSKAPLESLSPSDLRITEDDRGREIVRVTPATTPMSMAVVVDNQRRRRRRSLTFVGRCPASSRTSPRSARSRSSPPRTARRSSRTTRPTPASSRQAANRHFRAARFWRHAPRRHRRGLARPQAARRGPVGDRAGHDRAHRVQQPALLAGARRAGDVRRDDERGGLTEPARLDQNDPARNRAVVLDRGITDSGGTARGRAHQHELRHRAVSRWPAR